MIRIIYEQLLFRRGNDRFFHRNIAVICVKGQLACWLICTGKFNASIREFTRILIL